MKVCLTCQHEFADAEMMVCPHDRSPLIDLANPDPLLGSQVGGIYRIEERVGIDPYYPLYRARRDGDEIVSVLTYNVRRDNQCLKTFQAMVKKQAALVHPHICRIFAIGALPDGQRYVVSEHIDPLASLKQLLKKGPLDLDLIVKVFTYLTGALQYAHEMGVLHLDIKPANILLVNDAVKLINFGFNPWVVELSQADCHAAENFMRDPTYMSPEQLRGIACSVSADIYALGVVLFECLIGKPPFAGKNPISIAARKTTEKCPSFSVFDAKLAATIPDTLQDVVYKMLEMRPEDRYHSVTAFKVDFLTSVSEAKIR